MTNYEKRIISSYNRFIANVDKQLQGYMRRSNIPAFSNMLKKLTTTTFFYNHDVIKKAVGSKIVLIDNLVYDLLVEALAKSIYSVVNTTDRVDNTKVGWWTNSSIVDIIRRNSAFCPGGDDDAMYFVSYGFEAMSAETIDGINSDENTRIALMKFEDFSEAKFNTVVMAIINSTLNTIKSVRNTYWPTVYLLDYGESLDEHLVDLFLNALDSVKADASKDANLEIVFMEAVTLFGSSVLADGGVDLENVKDVLEKTTIRYANDKIKKTKTIIDALTMYYTQTGNAETYISVTFSHSTIATVFNAARGEIPKTVRAELGRRLKSYIIDFCNYVFLIS